MKLGDVLRKERERKKQTADEVASRLQLSLSEYLLLEAGASPAEKWGPLLARIAIALETPTSRPLAESGRSADTRPGQAGALIRRHRERRGTTPEEMAAKLDCALAEYLEIEGGASGIEVHGPQLLAFAEAIEQPVFNLFYPCGLPLDKLDDYP